jgi:hypothetical protein
MRLLLAQLLLLSAPALAGDALSVEAVRVVEEGQHASLTVHVAVRGTVDVEGRCTGSSRSGGEFGGTATLSPRDSHTFDLAPLPAGTHRCSARIVLTEPDGAWGEMNVPFEVEVLAPLVLTVDRADLDLEARRLEVEATRPLQQIEVQVFGPGGAEVGSSSVGIPGVFHTDLEWVQEPGSEAVKLVLTGRDTHGFSARLELLPWYYLIPHEDVVFETASDIVRSTEAPKLEAAWVDLQRVLAKYGSVVEVQLFVAGYTDTVGTVDYNQGLSERRARSLARWFRERGFTQPIHHQGFGEKVLAVPTPDETDEAGNRRAIYVLSAQAPPISEEIPLQAWVPLP